MRPLARTFVFNGLYLALWISLPLIARVVWNGAPARYLVLALAPYLFLIGLARILPPGFGSDVEAVDVTPHPASAGGARWISVLNPPFLLATALACGWSTILGLSTPLWFRLGYVALAAAGGIFAWLSARGEWRRWRLEKARIAEAAKVVGTTNATVPQTQRVERQTLRRGR